MKTIINLSNRGPGPATKTTWSGFLAKSNFVAFAGMLLLARNLTAGELPFQGRIEGTFVSTPTPDSTIYIGGAEAAGNATHVGAFTKVTSDVTDLSTGLVNGSFTMTAPNGDLLTGVYSGFIIPGNAPGTFSWLLNATFTGGTGRFENATGAFVFVAEGSYVTTDDGVVHGKYTETFEGTITY
jgi:hypothetical protein